MKNLEQLKGKLASKKGLENELTGKLETINEQLKEKLQKIGQDSTGNKDVEKLVQEVKELKQQKQDIEIRLEGFHAAQEDLQELAQKAVDEFVIFNREYESKIKESTEEVNAAIEEYNAKIEEAKEYRTRLTDELNDKKRDTESTIRGILQVKELDRVSQPYLGDIKVIKGNKLLYPYNL